MSGAVEGVAGWIVGNTIGQWRTFDSFGWAWTDRRDLAVRYARREDAELCHGEDEDSWRVERFPRGLSDESGDLTKQNQKARELLWDHVEEATGLPEASALYSEATVLSAMIAFAAVTPDDEAFSRGVDAAARVAEIERDACATGVEDLKGDEGAQSVAAGGYLSSKRIAAAIRLLSQGGKA